MSNLDLTPPPDLQALAALSARIGSDPLLIQAAGGNTSIKSAGVLWIKASGTLLAEAEQRDIFVPCDLEAMRAALAQDVDQADRAQDFGLSQAGLRPSIETSLHAVFPHRVVVHVHCVHTLAHVVQADPVAAIGTRLDGFRWCLVPYAKPGARLAVQVAQHVASGQVNVVLLGNHGLIVAGDDLAQTAQLLADVHDALAIAAADLPAPDLPDDLPPVWRPGPDSLSRIACDPARLSLALGGSLYPDHVIFCGVGMVAIDTPPAEAGTLPPVILLRGRGALVVQTASAGAWALAQCLGDVLARVPADARLSYLTAEENDALVNWDAEKYRQKLNG